MEQIQRITLSLFFLSSTIICAAQDYTALVNPFIGTGGHGHTFPGATLPFGMMQLSPDTRLTGWDGSSGYHYSDSIIYGFSHTHLSGTGIGDYCDVLFMPFTGDVKWKNTEYASPFSHANEKASPGYYSVLLDKDHIKAELTTSIRSGMHQYSFPSNAKQGSILIDLEHRDEVLESFIEKISSTELSGYRRSRSWAKDQRLYFYIRFQQPITLYKVLNDSGEVVSANKVTGKHIKIAVCFDLPTTHILKTKIGISAVDEAGAKRNLVTEIPGWDFTTVRNKAKAAWNKELSKIEVKGSTNDKQMDFYTALYHTFISPNIYQDVDGRYRGADLKVHQAKRFTNYTVFSLWDTYRAFHPLMTIINQQRTNDWINTFLAQYSYGGMLPIWELSGNETFTMIGYHSVPVIWDAYQKGIRSFDIQKALEAAVSYATSDRYGIPLYEKQGYLSNEKEPKSVSKTMEYAYDDWCIAQLAKALGKTDIYNQFIKRAQYYKNLFDKQVMMIRGKREAIWHSSFVANEINTFYTEGNAWQYAFAVPQDLNSMVDLYGGDQSFLKKLNELFTTSSEMTGFATSDVTGFIGQYAQGNEPSHHLAYLFPYVGYPWRTQELIHRIRNEFYHNNPDGLIGNEDCGQMSAWYVLSAMGFYPVCPGDGNYIFGTPLFDEVKIHLPGKKHFIIHSNKASEGSYFINKATWNGKRYTKSYITHKQLMNGGILQFNLKDTPNKAYGLNKADRPLSRITSHNITPVPYFNGPSYRFFAQRRVELKTIDSTASIYFALKDSTDTSTNDLSYSHYTQPFYITRSATIHAYAEKDKERSDTVSQYFLKLPDDKSIAVLSKVHPMYSAGEPEALIDGVLGDNSWRTGDWQGYPEQDFEAIIDLKSVRPVSYVGLHLLQYLDVNIAFPKQLLVEGSNDGQQYFHITTVNNTLPMEKYGMRMQMLGANVKSEARFIKVKATMPDPMPSWHYSAGSPSRIFISEVVVK